MGKLKGKRPTRRQKIIMRQQLGLNPDEWLVARWLPEVEYITLVNRHEKDRYIQKLKPEWEFEERSITMKQIRYILTAIRARSAKIYGWTPEAIAHEIITADISQLHKDRLMCRMGLWEVLTW